MTSIVVALVHLALTRFPYPISVRTGGITQVSPVTGMSSDIISSFIRSSLVKINATLVPVSLTPTIRT